MKKLTKFIMMGMVILSVFLIVIIQTNAAPGMSQLRMATNIPQLTATSLPQTRMPAVLQISTPTGKRPPACTFPLAQTTAGEPGISKEYVFSEPEVVLTADSSIGIVEWLPDNQRVLITQNIPGINRQTIAVFNPATGDKQVYAERTRMDQSPAWIDGLDAVIYPETTVMQRIEQNGTFPLIEFQRQLWVSQRNPQRTQSIEDVLLRGNFQSYISVSVEPWGHRILYYVPDEKKLVELSESLDAKKAMTLNLAQWEYRAKGNGWPIPYSMVWRPNTTQVFLYTLGDVGGYTFLLDVASGQLCEMDFHGWADIARWSPNGRYLAIVRTWGSRPVDGSDLAILDTETGKLYTLQIIPDSMEELHFVNDVAWAPDNRQLAAIMQVLVRDPVTQKYRELRDLYLVDFLSAEEIQISSSEDIGAGLGVPNLLWASDGSRLLVKCPTDQMDRLCLFAVRESDGN